MGVNHLRGPSLLFALTAVILSRPHAHGSPLDLFGFGGESPGVVGTGVATTTGYDAVYLNPAGLADTPGKRITLGTMAGDTALVRDDEPVAADRISGLIIGGAVKLPLGGALRDRVGLGLGFHIPLATINRARHPLPGVPVHVLLENRTHVIALQGALGVKLRNRWRVGIGVLALAELGGAIDVSADASGRFTTSSEQQMLARYTPIVGARYLMPERDVQVGVTFRGVSRSEYNIVITNDLNESLPLTIPTVTIAGVAQYDPLTVAAEASWQRSASLQLTGQLAYQRWSAYPLPTETPVEGAPSQPPPGFHDIVVPRVAAQWTRNFGATRVAARGGYAFVLSPAPEMDGIQSLLDNHRHIGSAGVGVAWPGTKLPFHLDAWVQLHWLMPRSHTKDPSNFEPDEPPPFDTLDTSGRILVGGVTLGVEL